MKFEHRSQETQTSTIPTLQRKFTLEKAIKIPTGRMLDVDGWLKP